MRTILGTLGQSVQLRWAKSSTNEERENPGRNTCSNHDHAKAECAGCTVERGPDSFPSVRDNLAWLPMDV